MFENRMAHVLAGDYTPLSAVDIFVKDLGLVLDTARASKFPLPLAATAHQMFMQASTAGYAKEDDSAVIKIFPASTCRAQPTRTRHEDHTSLLGCIADDFTGATDLANNLVRAGMRVVQTIGVPKARWIRTSMPSWWRSSRAPLPPARPLSSRWPRCAGCRPRAQQIYFKYCSTFDSTPAGNIGPVTDALMEALGTDFTIATPAFPDNKRTVFKGYLFVGDVLLNESGMQNHPLTPMTDPNLVRVLQAQTRRKVGLIDHAVVARGEAAIRAHRPAQGRRRGHGRRRRRFQRRPAAPGPGPGRYAGHGRLGRGHRPAGQLRARAHQPGRSPALPGGLQAVVSGSCSVATNQQVAHFIARGHPALRSTRCRSPPMRGGVGCRAGPGLGREHIAGGPVLVYSTAEPAAVQGHPGRLGVEQAGALVEQTIAAIARGLVERGVRQLIVAGGETSGACVQALGIAQMRIGGQIDPGVPWCHALAPLRRGCTSRSSQATSAPRTSSPRPLHNAGMTSTPAFMDEDQARDEICRVGRSLFERGYVHATAGNISVRLADGYLITPTDACLGTLQPERLARLDAQASRWRATGPARPLRCTGDLRGLSIDGRAQRAA
jgi:uncharacterized protein YgbK (DUF1537 family)